VVAIFVAVALSLAKGVFALIVDIIIKEFIYNVFGITDKVFVTKRFPATAQS
jgi:hypothetical protein